jgi:hypothetical protein
VEAGFPRDKRETRLRADHAQTKDETMMRFHLIASWPRAFSIPIESERRLYFFVLTRFLDANRYPPRIKSKAGFRLKTL